MPEPPGANPEPTLEDRMRRLERDVKRLSMAWDHWHTVITLITDRDRAIVSAMAQIISHTVVAVALIAAAVALSITGNDGNPAWAALGAYILGAGVQGVTAKKTTL